MSCDRRSVTVRNERQMSGRPIPADQSRHGERHRDMVKMAQRLWSGRADCSLAVWSDGPECLGLMRTGVLAVAGVTAVGAEDGCGDQADVGGVEVAQDAGEPDGYAGVADAGGDPQDVVL